MSKHKSALDAFATRFTRVVISLNWLVIILAVAFAGYVGQGARNLGFESNYRVYFSPQNPELRNFEEFQARFTKSDNFLFVVTDRNGETVLTPQVIAAIGEITEASWQIPYSLRVDSITNFQYSYANGDELIVEDLIETPSDVGEDYLAERIAIAYAEPLLKGQLISEDGRALTVNVTQNYPEASSLEVPEAVAAARAIRTQIETDYPNLKVYLTGTSMLTNAFSEIIELDFATLIPLMIAVIFVMTALLIRSFSVTLITMLVVLMSAALAMGWAAYVGIKLAGPSPSAVVVILTLAIADSVHILISVRNAMRSGLEKREAIIEGIRMNFLAVTITSITTAVGFLALNFSDSPPFRDFGNISAVGIVAAWGLSLTILPALLSIAPFRVPVQADAADRRTAMGRFADFVIAHHRKLLVITLAGSFALVAAIPRIEFNDLFLKYFDTRIEFRTDSDAAGEYFGLYPMEFSIDSGESGGIYDPAYLEKLDRFADWMRAREGVKHVYSVSDIVKRLNKNLNGDDPAFYKIPESYDEVAQYLFLYELSLPYGLDINDRIDIDKKATRLTASYADDVSTAQVREMLVEAEAWFAENAPAPIEGVATGPQIMFTFIAKRNIESMIQGTALAIVAIAFIMMVALRSVGMGLLSLVPNGLPILSAFGVWALLIGQVGFSVAAITSISLGIVIDDTVHLLTKYMRARRIRELSAEDAVRYAFENVGPAILFNTLILGAGFTVMTFSAFKINMELGQLTTMSIVLALVLDFLLLPALLLVFSRLGRKAES